MIAPTKPTRILDNPAASTKSTPNAEKKRGEERRINAIVELDKRRKEAKGARDREALLEIAGEYLTIGHHGGCPMLAGQIIAESENL